MYRLIKLTLALLFVCCHVAKAQYDAQFRHYFDLESTFNPAAVGKQNLLNVTAAYALNLAGFEHNPRTMFVSADAPVRFLNMKHGLGATFMNDQLGIFTHQRMALQYALTQPLLGGTLALGAQVGVLSGKTDPSRLDLNEANDPAFTSGKTDGNGIDLASGLYFYYKKRWYAGLSVQHLNAPRIELGERNKIKIDPSYYFTAGYNITLRNPFVSIKPSILLRTDGVSYRTDMSTRIVYEHDNKVLYAGIGYSPANSAMFMFGGSVKGFILGYAYELYTSSLSVGNGSHELVFRYQTEINFAKKGRNKHQTVRTL